MRYISAIVFTVALVVLNGQPAAAEQATQRPRIAVLWPSLVEQWNQAFVTGLRDNGYVPGANAVVDIRATGGAVASATTLAEELLELGPDVVFAVTGVLAKAVVDSERRLRKQVPIVVITQDPVAEGVIDSITHPNGNITGLAVVSAPGELMTKHLQLLHEMVASMKHVGLLVDDSWREFSSLTKAALEKAGPKVGVRIVTFEVRTPDDIDHALTEVAKRHVDALIVPLTPMFLATRAKIIDFTLKRRLPTAFGEEVFAYDGGLLSYGNSVTERYRHGAGVVARVLRGAKPADIPVDYNAAFRLVVNLHTAKSIGVRIPQALLLQADQVLR
jgi:putative ABC transport system substrate-binding protein